MSFFRKLKDRMFKSSSRLDEGLDAIIEDGADEDAGEDIPQGMEERSETADDAPAATPPACRT